MENLLIVANLSVPDPSGFSYGTGLEGWVKGELPDVRLLDLDAGSDKGYALQIRTALEGAKKAVLWLKSENAETGLGIVAPLAEFVVRNPEKCLLLLEGENRMVERLGKAGRCNFAGGREEELKRAIVGFFEIAV